MRFPSLDNICEIDNGCACSECSSASSSGLVYNVYADSIDIDNGSSSVQITGLGHVSSPKNIICTVEKPSSADANVYATVRSDSILPDGFIVDLVSELIDGSINADGYKLNYWYSL